MKWRPTGRVLNDRLLLTFLGNFIYSQACERKMKGRIKEAPIMCYNMLSVQTSK